MNALNPAGWRPDMGAGNDEAVAAPTFTGNRALQLEEPLLFEIGAMDRTGVDFVEETTPPLDALTSHLRAAPIPCRVSPNPRRSATTPGSVARTTRSTLACSRSAAAR